MLFSFVFFNIFVVMTCNDYILIYIYDILFTSGYIKLEGPISFLGYYNRLLRRISLRAVLHQESALFSSGHYNIE